MWHLLSMAICPDEDRVIDYPIGLISREKICELGHCVHNEPLLTRVF